MLSCFTVRSDNSMADHVHADHDADGGAEHPWRPSEHFKRIGAFERLATVTGQFRHSPANLWTTEGKLLLKLHV